MGKKAELVALISGTQIGFVLLAGAIIWGVNGFLAAISLLLGGAVGILSGLIMAAKVFQGGVIPTSVFLRRYYSGHFTKLLFVVVALAVTFKYTALDAFWVICGLIITQIIYLMILPFKRQ